MNMFCFWRDTLEEANKKLSECGNDWEITPVRGRYCISMRPEVWRKFVLEML